MYLGGADMDVYPAPGIVRKSHDLFVIVIMVVIMGIAMFFMVAVVVVVVAIAIVVVMIATLMVMIAAVVVVGAIREVMAVDVHPTMVIAVRLVCERAAYRLACVSEHDGKSAFALHDLRHPLNITIAQPDKAPHGRDAAKESKRSANRIHRRFLPSTSEASERRTAT